MADLTKTVNELKSLTNTVDELKTKIEGSTAENLVNASKQFWSNMNKGRTAELAKAFRKESDNIKKKENNYCLWTPN